jgi:hypothetical protein
MTPQSSSPFRHDAPELVAIKSGAWTLEKVKKEAERLFKLAEEAYIRSALPPEPNRKAAEALLIEIITRYHDIKVFGHYGPHDVEEFYKE